MWKVFKSSPTALEPKELCEASSLSIDAVMTTSSIASVPENLVADNLSYWAEAACASTAEQKSKDLRYRLLSALRYMESAQEGKAPFRQNTAYLLESLLARDVPAKLLVCLDSLDFECRKDTMRVFNTILDIGGPLGAERQVVDYVRSHPRILDHLLDGSGRSEIFTTCANMLRSCMRCPQLVEELFSQGAAARLINLAKHPNFDVASEAFSSLRTLLLAQKTVSSTYIESNFKEFFGLYHSLLHADDYVTQRQSLKLLGEVLLDRACMKIMLAYVSSEQYLQICMNLLRDNSRAIQVESFHVFKVFVANPHKPPRVLQILCRNKARLIKLLEQFGAKKALDAPVMQDLQTVLAVLKGLETSSRLRTPPATEQMSSL